MSDEGIGAKFQKWFSEAPVKFIVFGGLGLYALYRNIGPSLWGSDDEASATTGGGRGMSGAAISSKMDPESEAYINERTWQFGSITIILLVILAWLRHVNSKYETEEATATETERERARREAGLTTTVGKEKFDDLDEKKKKNKTEKKETEIKTGKEKTE